MIHITYCPFGVFAYNEQGKQIGYVLFKGDFKEQYESMKLCKKSALAPQEEELINKLKKQFSDETFLFETKKDKHPHQFPNIAGNNLRGMLEQIAQTIGVAKNRQEFQKLMYLASFEQTVAEMTSMNVEDRLIIQAVHAMEELDKIANTMVMRLREWYGFYFPELSAKTSDNEQFARYVALETYRKDVKGINVEYTIGSQVEKDDLETMKQYAEKTLALYDERKALEKYIDTKTRQIMPNAYAIAGGLLAAKLLSLAGNLEKLASFPSSTIQILGAEKALFRYLKGQGSSPKHGILFQSSFVQQAAPQSKGKIARVLASKLSIAVKIDQYKGDFRGDVLRQAVEKALQQSRREKTKGMPKKQRMR